MAWPPSSGTPNQHISLGAPCVSWVRVLVSDVGQARRPRRPFARPSSRTDASAAKGTACLPCLHCHHATDSAVTLRFVSGTGLRLFGRTSLRIQQALGKCSHCLSSCRTALSLYQTFRSGFRGAVSTLTAPAFPRHVYVPHYDSVRHRERRVGFETAPLFERRDSAAHPSHFQ